MTSYWVLPAATAVSWALTALIQRYAIARRLFDVPNHRSSHQTTTPRGGGIAIVLTVLGSVAVVLNFEAVDQPLIMTVCFGGGWIALIGFIDDHRHVPAPWRLLAHAFGVLVVFYWLGDALASAVAEYLIMPKLFVYSLGGICALWCINLYNFMDGIDGIASIEAITVCVGGALLYMVGEPGSDLWIVPAVLAAAVTGFLFWNYPPARIFMGDVGSGFLGFMMAVFLIQAANVSFEHFVAWTVLLAVFVVDATCTLFRRLLRKKRVYEAHRSHAYQYASRLHDSHAIVSLAVGVINVVFLVPIALFIANSMLHWAIGLMLAYTPIIGLAIRFKAGASELQTV